MVISWHNSAVRAVRFNESVINLLITLIFLIRFWSFLVQACMDFVTAHAIIL